MGSHFIIQARFLHCHCSISHGKASKRQRCLWRRCSKVPGKKCYGAGIAFKEGKDNKETMALLSCGSRIEILSECCEQLGGEASGM